VLIGPQLRLPGSDSGAVEFDQTGLPFVYQLRCLTRAALGTGKHPLHMDALLYRLVGLAGGMIGHMILTHKRRDVQPDFIQAGLSAGRGRLPFRAGPRLNWG
jgi:autotransporter translocation and assembly factor TamB